ncbi:MAG TPA: T9SS type A sorting domain-containing protein [Bacteroidia bacterium]|nr:T9SS type A sorting domain-containing protein [Bacteroidia bacterium]
MKNKKIISPGKTVLLLLGIALINISVRAAGTYTAVASGNWSSSLTWGGTPPPFKLATGDQVNIGTGFTVTMDSDVVINGLLAQISVSGTLSSGNSMSLNVTTGTLTGSGVIAVGHMMLNAGGTFSFTGSLTTQTLTNSIASLGATANFSIIDTLILNSALNIQTSGVLAIANNSVIQVSGGQLLQSGGSLNFPSAYNVNYVSTSSTTGMELSGSGLKNININVGNGNNVTLGNNLTSNDTLKLTSGTLILNGDSLVINGKIAGTSTLTGDASADLTINTTGGLATALTFADGGQMLKNLTLNIGANNSVILASNLSVTGNLALTNRSNLDISGVSFSLDGTLSGTGVLLVNSGSKLLVNTTSSIITPISLSGSSIGGLTVNVGNGNSLTLGMTIGVDTLNLESGSLVLNNNSLGITGDIVASGNGTIFSTSASNVSVNTAVSPTGTLAFSYPGNIVRNMNINIGGGGSITMGSDLVVQGILNFTTGHLNTGSYNVQIASGGSIAGANNNAYIITSTNGVLTMAATTSSATTFPVGTASYYFPANITLNSSSPTGTFGINVSQGVYSQGTSGTLLSSAQPMVDATWMLQTSISSGLNYNAQLYWSPATEVNGFVHANDYISQYTAGHWDTSAYTTATGGAMFNITRDSLTSASLLAVFDSNTSAPTGIIEANNSGQFQTFPNPASNDINIVNNNSKGQLLYIDVINTLGQIVGSFRMADSRITLPVADLKAGVYFIKLYNNTTNVTEKFIKAE